MQNVCAKSFELESLGIRFSIEIVSKPIKRFLNILNHNKFFIIFNCRKFLLTKITMADNVRKNHQRFVHVMK